MPAVDPEELAKAWETATPLREYIEKRATRECRETIPGWPTNWTPGDDTRGSHLRRQQWKAKQNTVRPGTTYDLFAGQLVGLGRMSDSNAIEFVSEAFWDGADVDWQAQSARGRDGRTVSEIRIMNEASAEPNQLRKSARSAPTRTKSKKAKRNVNRSKSQTSPTKRVGRPKSRDKIIAKYHELCETRPGFEGLNIEKEMAPEIRVALRDESQRKVQTRGLSDSHIAKIIGQERSRSRNPPKPTKPSKPN